MAGLNENTPRPDASDDRLLEDHTRGAFEQPGVRLDKLTVIEGSHASVADFTRQLFLDSIPLIATKPIAPHRYRKWHSNKGNECRSLDLGWDSPDVGKKPTTTCLFECCSPLLKANPYLDSFWL